MKAVCIENKAGNPCHSVGKAYEITEEGLANDYTKGHDITDTWNGQFSSSPMPKLKAGTEFGRNGCRFRIEAD